VQIFSLFLLTRANAEVNIAPREIMKRELLFSAFVSLVIAISGCCSHPDEGNLQSVEPVVSALRNQVSTVQNSISKAQEPLNESEQHIDDAKVGVLSGADSNKVSGELDLARVKVEEGNSLLAKASVNIGTAMNTAAQAVADAEHSDKAIKTLQKDNADLQNKLNSEQQWVYKLLAGVAAFIMVAGIGICVASVLTGFASMKIGVCVSTGGVALLVLTLTIQKYQSYLIAGCGILLLVLMIYFGWKLFTSFKANKELVQFGEAIKTKASDDLKKELFGDNNSPHPDSVADSIQSESTQQIVDAVRKQLQIKKIKNS